MLLKPQLHPQDQISALEAKFENLQPLNLIRDADLASGMHIWPQGRISDLSDTDLAAGALVWQQGHWSGSRDANLASWLQIWRQMGFSVVKWLQGYKSISTMPYQRPKGPMCLNEALICNHETLSRSLRLDMQL